LCSGAKRAGGNSTLRLALSGHSQNVTLKLEDISKRRVKNVPDLLTDEVVLFSGGLDSLSGAIEELSTDGKRVALVSHRSSPKIYDHQKHLVTELNARFPQKLMHVPVLVTRQGPLRAQEYTQRSRSFLYAALVCVVTRLFGRSEFRFYENGVVSINLPISEQVVGARATRSTHPLVLNHSPKFFSAAVGKPIDVDNPFVWKTKGDVVRSIVDHGCGGLIKHTVSCTRVYDITKLHTHCGCCSQCLDRRFAILAANAADHDPVEMYKVELLTGGQNVTKKKKKKTCALVQQLPIARDLLDRC
jgi:7-cyano-7-deazaguanine synthase in queuosine biosynthesis